VSTRVAPVFPVSDLTAALAYYRGLTGRVVYSQELLTELGVTAPG
jgi:hypothetical protein